MDAGLHFGPATAAAPVQFPGARAANAPRACAPRCQPDRFVVARCAAASLRATGPAIPLLPVIAAAPTAQSYVDCPRVPIDHAFGQAPRTPLRGAEQRDSTENRPF